MRVIHHKSKTPTYWTWKRMISRCTNPKDFSYRYYGGIGISVSSNWMDYETFLLDMGERPSGCTIDRIDSTKNYCKENCRWATGVEQNNNKQSTMRVTYKNKTQSLMNWARELDKDYGTLWSRIAKYNWTIDEAFSFPVGRFRVLDNRGERLSRLIINIEYGIFYESISEAARSVGLKRTTLTAMLTGQNKNKTNLKYV